MRYILLLVLAAAAAVNGANTGTRSESNFQRRCRINGGDGAYERARLGEQKYEQCGQLVLSIWSHDDVAAAVANGTTPELMKTYCSQYSPISACYLESFGALDGCIDHDLRDMYNRAMTALTAALEYVCSNEGQHLANFVAGEGSECFKQSYRAVQQCHTVFFGDVDVMEWGRRREYSTAEGCSNLRDLKGCIVEAMKTCPLPGPAEEADGIMNVAYDTLPCPALNTIEANV